MRYFQTLAISAITLATLTSATLAGTPKAIAAAEQSAAVAICKLEWLKSGGTGARSAEYFTSMADCLVKSAPVASK